MNRRSCVPSFFALITCCIFGSQGCRPVHKLHPAYCLVENTPDREYIRFDNIQKTFRGVSWSDVAGMFIAKGSFTISNDTLILEKEVPSMIDSIIAQGSNEDGKTIIRFWDIQRGKSFENTTIWVDDKEHYPKNGEFILDTLRDSDVLVQNGLLQESFPAEKVRGRSVQINIDWGNLNTFGISNKWMIRGQRLISIEDATFRYKACDLK